MTRGQSLIVALFLSAFATVAFAKDTLAPLRAQFALPEARIDYADAKLTVDRLIDPTTDVPAVRRQLAHWERAVRTNIPAGATPRQSFDALIKTLYEAGPWNDGKPFAYDLDDPLGKNPRNKQLATYLATRRGNCISMPLLVVILGQRLGLPAALATAPQHVLVKFGDDAQQAWINFEATAGGFKSDSSYERETGITQLAIDNALYLRPLSPKESLGVIATSLMEHHSARKDGDTLMEVADLALSVNPRDVTAMIWKANAFFLQLQSRYVQKYPEAKDIPPALQDDFRLRSRENLAWFEKAERLGWTQPTPEQEAAYLQSIEREKRRR
ncbi:hypothetical protein LVB87_15550 [Lysobacter sp. KIS68-7]|uniref:transglutaminase family protein n=1 Tax=Lysobacter sp. KIS68-7 TaxID=2904252 RepID=UPI001E5BDD4A|nr:transglutaminase family protein [Lysobacter sp. KIS68-7]UHQ19581.1 hypothetical protein LVB87_15550 [Lysobacter sp. KIS68-7]